MAALGIGENGDKLAITWPYVNSHRFSMEAIEIYHGRGKFGSSRIVGEWRRGDAHTNSVENIWSLLKRSIIGSYHKVSVKYLDAYLDELEWRFNNRDNPWLFRDTLKRLLQSGNLPYEALVSENTLP